MFWGFPPFDVIIDTFVSKDSMKSNGLPVWSRAGVVLRIKYYVMIRFKG